MDLVGFSEERFDAVVREVLDFAPRLGLHGVSFIPVSALHGDNVVDRSEAMPWYAGESLLEHLERVPAGRRAVRRPGAPAGAVRDPRRRRRAGTPAASPAARCASATRSSVLPIGHAHTRGGVRGRRATPRAAPRSIAVALEDELDVGRGDLLARPAEAPGAACAS